MDEATGSNPVRSTKNHMPSRAFFLSLIRDTRFYIFLYFLLGFCLFFFRSEVILGDGHGYYVYARSILFDGDINSLNEFQYLINSGRATADSLPNLSVLSEGYAKNPWPIGLSIIWFLPVLLVFGSYQIIGLFYPQILDNHNGYNIPYQFVILLSALLFTWIYYHFSKKSIEEYKKHRQITVSNKIIKQVLIASVIVTPLFFYSLLSPSFSHIYSAGLISVVLYLTIYLLNDSNRFNIINTIIYGASFGLIVSIRPQHALLGIIPVYLFGVYLSKKPKIKIILKYFFDFRFFSFSAFSSTSIINERNLWDLVYHSTTTRWQRLFCTK
jgi:hypothetical protein